MRRKFLFVLFILVGLPAIAAGVAWYLLNNESFLKQYAHNLVMRKTGRALDVAGRLSLQLGKATTIEAGDVRFSNPRWLDEPTMGSAGHIRIVFDPWSLFKGPLTVHKLEVSTCRIDLVKNASGEANWKLIPEAVKLQAPENGEGRGSPEYRLQELNIKDCEVSLDEPDRKTPLDVRITELDSRLLGDGMSQAHALGALNQVPLAFEGKVGPVRALWEGGPFEEELKLSLGKISLVSTGSLADARNGDGANISIRFSGPEFEEVTDYLALPPFSSDTFDFTLELKTHDHVTDLKLDGDLGSFKISSSGEIDRIRNPEQGQLSLTAKGPNLEALGQLFGIEGLVPEPFSIQLDSSINAGKITLGPTILETALDRVEVEGVLGSMPDLEATDLAVKLHSEKLGRWAQLVTARVASLETVEASGRLNIDASGLLGIKAEATHLGSRLSVNGSLGPFRRPKQPLLDFELQSPDVSQIAGLLHIGKLTSAPIRAGGRYHFDSAGYHFNDIKLKLGDSQASFTGLLSDRPKWAGSEFRVEADIPSTTAFGMMFGYKGWPDQPLKLAGTVNPSESGLTFEVRDGQLGSIRMALNGAIPDVGTPSDFSVNMDMKLPSLRLLSFLVPEVNLPDLPMDSTGELAHRDGTFSFRQLHLKVGQSTAEIDGDLTSAVEHSGSSLKFSASGPDYTEFLQLPELDSLGKEFSVSGHWSRDEDGNQLDSMKLSLGDITAQLDGQVDKLLGPENLDLQIHVIVPEPSGLSPLFGHAAEAKPLSIDVQLEGSLHNLSLKKMSAKHGASRVTGDMQLKLGDNGQWSGSLESEFLDLKAWAEDYRKRKESENKNAPPGPAAPEEIFPDTPIMSLYDPDLDIHLDLEVDRIDLGNTQAEQVRLGVVWTDQELKLDPIEAHDRQGSKIAGAITLDARGSVPQLDVKLNGYELRLGLTALEDQDPSTYPPADVEVDLQGKGKTWHEIASSLDGNLRAFAGAGLVAESGIDIFFSDFIGHLFRTLNPVAKTNKYTQLECGFIAANVVSGRVNVDPIILQTQEVTVVSQGTINLETERIDLAFNTRARKGFGISAGVLINPFIKVGGTLAHPAMELDAANAMVSSGAAVATAGISLLAKGFSDRFLSSKDPCGDARKKLLNAGSSTK